MLRKEERQKLLQEAIHPLPTSSIREFVTGIHHPLEPTKEKGNAAQRSGETEKTPSVLIPGLNTAANGYGPWLRLHLLAGTRCAVKSYPIYRDLHAREIESIPLLSQGLDLIPAAHEL